MKKLMESAADPNTLLKFHAFMTFLWWPLLLLIYVAGLKDSVFIVLLISVYANSVGHFSSWQAVRTELRQLEQMEDQVCDTCQKSMK